MLCKFKNTCSNFKKWDSNAQLSFKELQTLEIYGQEQQEALVKLQKSNSYLMDNMLTWDLPQVLTNGSNGKNADRCLHPHFLQKLTLTCKATAAYSERGTAVFASAAAQQCYLWDSKNTTTKQHLIWLKLIFLSLNKLK